MTDHLRRGFAPVSDAAWQEIDAEAARTLRHFLVGRAVVDVDDARGWEHSAHNLGRVEPLATAPVDGVEAAIRKVQPLAEVRSYFEVPRVELDSVDRGSSNPDLAAVGEAARRAATAEDRAIFGGWAAAGIHGIVEASPHPQLAIADDYDLYPGSVARAVATLRTAGIEGPYGIVLGPRCYTGVIETTEHGGYPVLEHIRLILGGPIYWAPEVDGAVVISLRGGDYTLHLGQDLAVGYDSHDSERVRFFIEESFTFTIDEEAAAVALVYR